MKLVTVSIRKFRIFVLESNTEVTIRFEISNIRTSLDGISEPAKTAYVGFGFYGSSDRK